VSDGRRDERLSFAVGLEISPLATSVADFDLAFNVREAVETSKDRTRVSSQACQKCESVRSRRGRQKSRRGTHRTPRQDSCARRTSPRGLQSRGTCPWAAVGSTSRSLPWSRGCPGRRAGARASSLHLWEQRMLSDHAAREGEELERLTGNDDQVTHVLDPILGEDTSNDLLAPFLLQQKGRETALGVVQDELDAVLLAEGEDERAGL
jgi:hypothetical protein